MRRAVPRSELLRKRLDAFTRALKGFEHGDVRGLHRTRVASRRLRELIPILQLDRARARKLSRRLRKITTRLGTVRELDVLLMSIDELHVSRRARGSALGHVGVSVSKDRDRARKRLTHELPVDDIRRLVRKLERVVDDLRVGEAAGTRLASANWRWAIDARLARRAERLAQTIRDAGAVYLPDRLHDVRVAIKKMRYALELARDAAGERDDADVRTLRRAQDLLGRMHDMQVLTERVREVHTSLAPATIPEWRDLDALVASLEDDCRRVHARYMKMRDAVTAIADRAGDRRHAAPARAAVRRAG